MIKSKTTQTKVLNGLISKRQVAAVAVFALLALCLFVSPPQAAVVLFKASLVTFFAVLAYWIDKFLQPQVDMGDLADVIETGNKEERDAAVKLAQAVMIRRALITVAVVLGGCLGL